LTATELPPGKEVVTNSYVGQRQEEVPGKDNPKQSGQHKEGQSSQRFGNATVGSGQINRGNSKGWPDKSAMMGPSQVFGDAEVVGAGKVNDGNIGYDINQL
jgi:hypothetical protein